MDASGLVAAVVAGLVTGHGAPKFLTPGNRASDMRTWRAIELALEGTVFLIMGLEMSSILHALNSDSLVELGIKVAFVGLAAIVAIRAAYVAIQLWYLNATLDKSRRRFEERRRSILEAADQLTPPDQPPAPLPPRMRRRIRRRRNDLEFYESQPLGWREGVILTWGGMRGVVTLVAAQTIPAHVPSRHLIIFIAFVVAATSLIVQGGTLEFVVKWLKPAGVDEDQLDQQRQELREELQDISIRELERAGVAPEALQTVRDHVAEAVTSADSEPPTARKYASSESRSSPRSAGTCWQPARKANTTPRSSPTRSAPWTASR